MEFRLLGPLEVVVDGLPQRPPGRGERALLALLALTAGRMVSAAGSSNALGSGEHAG